MRVPGLLAKILLSLVILVLLSAPSRAEDWSIDGRLGAAFPWAGFAPGTMVRYRTTTDIKVRGRDDLNRTEVEETRLTLVEITETEYVIKVEKRIDGEWAARKVRTSRVYRTDAARSGVEEEGEGKETLSIEGKAYVCTKKKLADVSDLLDGPPGPGEVRRPEDRKSGVVWEHETLGVLKVEAREPTERGTATTTLVATKIDVTHEVGEATLSCREFTWSTNMIGGKTVRLESVAVPGRTVLTTGEVEQGPVKMSHRKELVGLTIKTPPKTGGR